MNWNQALKGIGCCLLAVAVANCSRKSKTDGDGAANADMAPTDLASQAGAPIPELNTVFFDYDSFAIRADSRAQLAKHAEWMKNNPGRRVQIEGHCDERGTTEYNLALGERRAGAVKDFLVSRGVNASQINTISYGEERPATAGSTEDSWSRNRRAEFVSAGN
jgi:peptidoglycan-associated lipoprotein